MPRLPFISEASEGIYQVCTAANTDYVQTVPPRAIAARLWFETSAASAALVTGRVGFDVNNRSLTYGNIVGSGGPLPGTAIDVTFTGDLGRQDVPEMTATSSLVGTTPAIAITTVTAGSATTNEVQRIAITGTATSGTFTLTFNGGTTAALPYNATATQVQNALLALASASGLTNTSTNLAYHPAQMIEYDIPRSYTINNNTNTADTVYLHLASNTAGAVVRGQWLYGADA